MVEFDNPIVYAVAALWYVLLMGVVWKLGTWASIDFKTKIILTVVAYPIFYLVTDMMANK